MAHYENVEHAYSRTTSGGIGYRLDIDGVAGGQSFHHSYTTNPDGSGLFFHDGRGGRRQTSGNGQFSARSLRQFQAKTQRILSTYADAWEQGA
jgi:hypothetical protein